MSKLNSQASPTNLVCPQSCVASQLCKTQTQESSSPSPTPIKPCQSSCLNISPLCPLLFISNITSSSTSSHPDLCRSCLTSLHLVLVTMESVTSHTAARVIFSKYTSTILLFQNTSKSSHCLLIKNTTLNTVCFARFGPYVPSQPHLALDSSLAARSGDTSLVSCSLLSHPTSSARSLLLSPLYLGNAFIRSNFPMAPIQHPLCHVFLISSNVYGSRYFYISYVFPTRL